MPLAIGQIMHNRYRVLGPLGQGGMGAVYLAEDLVLGRRCALKENIPDPNASPQVLAQMRQQFRAEAQVLANLDHPNLPKVHDFFSHAGNEYMVMEYVEGEDLHSLLQRHGGPLPEQAVLAWADQVLDALAYLHSQQPHPIIHRDIKPANIILTPQGKVKLVDFGLVKLLDPHNPRTATVMKGMGTPEYAPLEQYASGVGHTDARSDIYSLGGTLYHLLTGDPPPDIHQRLLDPNQVPAPRRLNPRLAISTEAALLKALEIYPNKRFSGAAEMRRTLIGVPTGGALVSSPSVSGGGPRLRPTWPLLFVGAIATVVLLVMVLRGGGDPPHATPAPSIAALSPASTPTQPADRRSLLPMLNAETPLYFTSTRTGKREIHRLNGDGQAEQVSHTPNAGESWSPVPGPSSILFFVSNRDDKREIYRLDATGQIVRVTHTPGTGESWSPALGPNGTLYFTSNRDGKDEIHLLDADGEIVQVTNTPASGRSWSPVVAPNNVLYWTSDRDGYPEIYRFDESGQVIRVTHTPGLDGSWAPTIARDGTLFFTSKRDGKAEIYRLAPDGTIDQVSHTPGSAESWAPQVVSDGLLLFNSNRDSTVEIYRLENSGRIVRVTHTPGAGLSWLPDEN